MLQSSGKGNALVKESFYARKAFFIDNGVGKSLVSEGEGEEGDKADLDLSSLKKCDARGTTRQLAEKWLMGGIESGGQVIAFERDKSSMVIRLQKRTL